MQYLSRLGLLLAYDNKLVICRTTVSISQSGDASQIVDIIRTQEIIY